jgi:hypothetical protein
VGLIGAFPPGRLQENRGRMNKEMQDGLIPGQRYGHLGAGLAIGVGVGVALGVALDNVAMGIAVGVGIGIALGAGMKKRKDPQQGGNA